MRSVAAFLASTLLLTAADPQAASARKKLSSIEHYRAARGSMITLTPEEVNAWAREEMPSGIRAPRVKLGANTAEIEANVDVIRMAQAGGNHVNGIIARLFQGERPMRVSLRLDSGNARITLFITAVEVNGVPVTGSVLEFLVETLVSRFPGVRVNRPFDLSYNLDRIDIRPIGIRAFLKR
jgi:hypothetical protein